MKFLKGKSLIICTFLISISIIMCSCGSSDKSTANAPNTITEIKSSDSNIAPTTGVSSDQSSAANGTADKKDSTVSYEKVQNGSEEDRKIVKSSSLVIESTTYDKSLESLNEKIKKAGGYIENSNETGSAINDDSSFKSRNAKFTLRIPTQNYDAFINDAGNIGNIINKVSNGEDVTSQYFDTEAHLKTLKTEEARLLDLLNKTGDLKDILTLETELSNTRYQIETLTGSLKKWDNLVDYSKVTIEIQEVQKLTEVKDNPLTLAGKIKKSFISSCKAMFSVLKGLLIALVAIVPFIPLIIIIYFIVRFIYKRYKAKYDSKKTSDKN